MTPSPELPRLPLQAWEPTKTTLHLWAQIVGKVRLATAAPRNHWWHAPLYVDVRGLTTRRLHRAGVTFELAFDLVDHRLVLRTLPGDTRSFPLHDGLTVADFDARLHGMLVAAGVDVAIREEPFGVPMTTPFTEDREHAAYDPEYVERFWRALDWADMVLEEFSGWFCGKQSPVHLFWHSLDLALTRFSGRRAPPMEADAVTREGYSHELVSFGFWAGDQNLGEAAFYSYTAPEPDGLRGTALRPRVASWTELPTGAIAVLPYEAVRTAPDPRTTLLAFLQSAYEAGAGAAGWDLEGLRSSWCPPAPDLGALDGG